MRNRELVKAVTESGGVKRVKGSNLTYIPASLHPDYVGLKVPESWQLLGLFESYEVKTLAFVLTNKLTGRYEVWASKRGTLTENKYVRHIKELLLHKPFSNTDVFELAIPERTCQLRGPQGETYITRAHSYSFKPAINAAREVAVRAERGYHYCSSLSRLRSIAREVRRVALTGVGNSEIHNTDNDPQLHNMRSQFFRIEKLLERTEGMDEGESRPFFAAYFMMECG